ncbi:MAG: transposase, partial [Deltaproteobacteria bacterium]|nr:transposase [Deltaproteobacteria bacterium]
MADAGPGGRGHRVPVPGRVVPESADREAPRARAGKLYAVEAEVADLDGDIRRARLAELRRERSKPIIDEIKTWLMNQAALPRSGLGKAIGYALTLWDGLVRFADDARIPIDTNLVERGMRPVAVGRKNHYGSKSERGTRVAALFYTLIESATHAGIEPAG